MANQIVYSEEELELAKTNLNDSINILKNDIESSLNNDFSVLEELDLFSNGLAKLKRQTSSLGENHTSLVNKLTRHASSIREDEDARLQAIDDMRGRGKTPSNNYAGGSVSGRSEEGYEKENGKAVTNSYLKEIIPELSAESKLQMLKNILVYKSSVTALLGNEAKANMLIYYLKRMLKDEGALQSSLALDEEKELQKIIIESIAKEDKNLFAEIDEASYFAGLSFYKEVALKNNINVSDLLMNKEHEKLLMQSFHDIYFNSTAFDINEQETMKVKEFFDLVAKKHNMEVEKLLSDVNNMKLIKEGIINDSESKV